MSPIDLGTKASFHDFRTRVEMVLARRFEADGVAYWTARDVAMRIVQKAKKLRSFWKKGISPTVTAASLTPAIKL